MRGFAVIVKDGDVTSAGRVWTRLLRVASATTAGDLDISLGSALAKARAKAERGIKEKEKVATVIPKA